MWLNMNCVCAIYVDRNQRAFLAQMTSFVMLYYVICHSFPINSPHLMSWGVNRPVKACCKVNMDYILKVAKYTPSGMLSP